MSDLPAPSEVETQRIHRLTHLAMEYARVSKFWNEDARSGALYTVNFIRANYGLKDIPA